MIDGDSKCSKPKILTNAGMDASIMWSENAPKAPTSILSNIKGNRRIFFPDFQVQLL